ncbi:MAG: beta strand repeat-containing protein [Calditrichia bacterium]
MVNLRMILTVPLLLLLVVFSGQTVMAQGITHVWDGTDGNWSDATKWNPATVPGPSDFVEISSGTITLDGFYTIVGGVFSGGRLEGPNRFVVNGALSWTGGTFAIDDSVMITTNGSLSLTGGNARNVDNSTILNSGTITLSGNNAEIMLMNDGFLRNDTLGTIEFLGNGSIAYADSTNNGFIVNRGTIKKLSGGGTSVIDAVLVTTGELSIQAGEFLLTRSSVIPVTGSITINPGAVLKLDAATFPFNNAIVGGGGELKVLEATLFATGIAGVIIAENTELSMVNVNATLDGDGPIVVAGNLDWQRGIITGTGNTNVLGNIDLIDGGTRILDGRTLTVNGTALWSGTKDIRLTGGSTLEIGENGFFNIENNEEIFYTEPGGGQILVKGTFAKSSGGNTTTLEVPLNNQGLVEVSSGRLLLEDGGDCVNGTYTTYSGATTEMRTGTFSFNGGVVKEDGNFQLSGDNITTSGSSLTIDQTGLFIMGNGELNNNTTITNNGVFDVIKGTISGVGTIISNGEFNIYGSSTKSFVQQQIFINGGGSLDGDGTPRMDNQARITNGTNSTFEILSDVPLELFNNSGLASFVNKGTMIKSGGTGATVFQPGFLNSGTLSVNTGSMRFERGVPGDHSSGTIITSSGTTVDFINGTFGFSGVTFDGNGTVNFLTEVVVNVDVGGMQVNSGVDFFMDGSDTEISGIGPVVFDTPFNWGRGFVSGSGILTMNSGGSFYSENRKVIDGKTIVNNGTLNFDSGDMRMDNGGLVINSPNAEFNLNLSTTFGYRAPGGGTIDNQGTFNANAAGFIDVIFDNSSVLNIVADTLSFTRQLNNKTNGIIAGSGFLDLVNSGFDNDGVVSPGSSPGKIIFDNEYSQNASGRLNIEIGGTDPGTGYDQIEASAMSLDGTLNISFINGFFPSLGQTFEVLNYNTRSDTFQTINTPSFGDIPIFAVEYQSDKLLLTTINDSKISVNMKAYLQGAYIGGGQMSTSLRDQGLVPVTQPYNTAPWNYDGAEQVTTVPTDVVDWVLFEIRTSTTDVLVRRAAFLKKDGSIVELDGVSAICLPGSAGNYYLAVYHRNHLPIMSANAVSLSETAGLYNFSTGQGQAFGTDAMVEVSSGVFALPGGNADANAAIDLTDLTVGWKSEVGLSGYKLTDFNMNGQIQNTDKNFVWKAARGKSSQLP